MKRKPSSSTRAPRRERTVHDGSQAMSLHIGLNCVDPHAYAGWTGELCACEADALALAEVASRQGFATRTLLTQRATRQGVLQQVRRAAGRLEDGGFFWISYSGHGGQVPDRNGDERDKLDETWCLHDGQLIDDELTAELAGFGRGVRVLVTTDCCHSGIVARAHPTGSAQPLRLRMMPPMVAQRTYEEHKAFYDRLQRTPSMKRAVPADPDEALARVTAVSPTTPPVTSFDAAVVFLAGCHDNQLAGEGDEFGVFTEHLLKLLDDGRFPGSYRTFHAALVAAMPTWQSPVLLSLGPCRRFLGEKPLRVRRSSSVRSGRA